MQQDDKTVHICHTRLRWYFLLLSVVFPLKHTVQIIKMKPLSEKKQNKTKKKPFLQQTEGQRLACIIFRSSKNVKLVVKSVGKIINVNNRMQSQWL